MIILVAGVPGVGKTFLGAPVAEQLGILHAATSQLIRKGRGLQSLETGTCAASIDESQVELISAVQRLLACGQDLLLDGPFVLRGNNGEHNEIDPRAFYDLQIGAVVLLEAYPEAILKRLVARGHTSWRVSDLVAFADKEAAHARNVASELGVAFHSLRDPSESQFRQTVEMVRGRLTTPGIGQITGSKAIIEYSGELDWINGREFPPLIVNALEVRENERHLLINFRGDATNNKRIRPYSGQERAEVSGNRPYWSYGRDIRVRRMVRGEPLYETGWFNLYPNAPSPRSRLELKVKELGAMDGRHYCYVEACWFDEGGDDDYSECQGLLEGYET